ncbi:MAG: hypothetical protein Q8P80_00420 [Candidatus Levybacteria bacterium]|nr:hypothetical protein [Candidatus Levybacteria bacterium]
MKNKTEISQLSSSEQDKLLSFQVVDRGTNLGHAFPAVPIEEGRNLLLKYLMGEIEFDRIPSMYISPYKKRKNLRERGLYAGNIGSDIRITFNDAVYSTLEKNEIVILLPRKSENHEYQCLDCYELGEKRQITLEKKLNSILLNRETHRFQLKEWRGIECQLFLDFMAGKGKASVLKPFTLTFTPTNLSFGNVLGKHINLGLKKGHLLREKNGTAIITPRYDEATGYVWIEVYNPYDTLILNKQIINSEVEGEPRKFVKWDGIENRSLADWMNNKLPISLVRKRTLMPEELTGINSTIYFPSAGCKVKFDLIGYPPNQLDRTKPAIIEPFEDDLYKWLEFKQSRDDHQITISKARVDHDANNKLYLARWIGSEKQRIIDFLEGKIKAEQLTPFSQKLSGAENIFVTRYKGAQLSLHCGRIGYKPGDMIDICPEIDSEGNFIIMAYKQTDRSIRRKFQFNPETLEFSSVKEKQKTASISLDEAREELSKLLEVGE